MVLSEETTQLGELIDDALHALPERHRTSLVLFHLQGHSLEETAALMDCRPGTLYSWLSRGRVKLRRQLERRGLVMTAPALTLALSGFEGTGALSGTPTQIANTALCHFSGQAAAGGLLSARAAALSKGAIQTMWLSKTKWVAGVTLIVCGLGGGMG